MIDLGELVHELRRKALIEKYYELPEPINFDELCELTDHLSRQIRWDHIHRSVTGSVSGDYTILERW